MHPRAHAHTQALVCVSESGNLDPYFSTPLLQTRNLKTGLGGKIKTKAMVSITVTAPARG